MCRFLALAAALAFVTLAGCPGLGFGAPCGRGDDEGGGATCAGDFTATPPAGAPAGAVCSTSLFWQGGDHGSAAMHPGVDCVGCHAQSDEGPRYVFAGTVMGAAHDADDCQGISGVTVRITDADGVDHDLVTNAAGSFFNNTAFSTPFTAAVLLDGRTTQMITPQTDANCMHCHTVDGLNAAPGRILAP